MAMHSDSRALARVRELIDRIGIGMLCTVDQDGTLRSRPLQTVGVDPDGALWFFTSATSPKVEEAKQAHGQVNLSYADPERMDFVSITGSAQLVRERPTLQAHWTPRVKPWFPEGLDDPDLALLRVVIEKAEYWESPGNTVERYVGLARSAIGDDPGPPGAHEKIELDNRLPSDSEERGPPTLS